VSRRKKLLKLKNILARMGSVVIAYSGGLDSAFLLKAASIVLPGRNILAVTAASEIYPRDELDSAKKIARSLGVRHKIIRTNELGNSSFVRNTPQRCFYCKKELFTRLQDIASRNDIKFIADATNLSDAKDFRPGGIAIKRLGIRSPLKEAGMNKEDIRVLSKKMRLETWDKPALACLASRIPYGVKITAAVLRRIEKAEAHLKRAGFRQVRLRHHGKLCRIEVERENVLLLVKKRKMLVEKLKALGYNYITVDLEGYRTGSFNEIL